MSDDDRLDETTDELIAEDEEPEDRERDVPVGENGERQKRRQRRAQERADVRHEAHQSGDHAPQRRVRHAEEKESDADEKSESEIEKRECQQVPADAMRRLADR